MAGLMVAIANSISSNYVVSAGGGFDPNAEAFITAAGITNPTQQNAINDLVLDLKAASIWTKFNALYPIIGGTASSHAVNLKTPGTFNLTFATGFTHSSTGMLPNGTSAYANTNFIANGNLTLYNSHQSYYSRTSGNPASNQSFMGNTSNTGTTNNKAVWFITYTSTGSIVAIQHSSATASDYATGTGLSSRAAFWMNNRTSSTSTTLKAWRNGIALANATTTPGGEVLNTATTYLGARRNTTIANPQAEFYTNAECAFASIGDGLTDAESQVFYQIVEKYQLALGRNINPTQSFYYNRNYNNETNAFLFATQITDTTQQTAVNTLVNDFKSAGIWTKMRAVYPIVGGSASSHAVNLKTPGTYNLTFATGFTHSSTGMLPNGTSAFANTFLGSAAIGLNTGHLSFYSRTNSLSAASKSSIGSLRPQSGANSYSDLGMGSVSQDYFRWNNSGTYDNIAQTNTLGFYNGSRTASNVIKLFKNGAAIVNGTAASQATSSVSFYISAANNNGVTQNYDNKECAFASIGDGLNDTEAANFYTAVQNFQTTLNRQV